MTRTAKGNKNCVRANNNVLVPALPPVTVDTNFFNKKNWMIPVAKPIIMLKKINNANASKNILTGYTQRLLQTEKSFCNSLP